MAVSGPELRKAVIVEDSPLVADDLAGQLADLGYQVCGITASAAEAMQLLNQYEPDLVTLDINLGGGSEGLGVATVLRATGQLPIVFVTANAGVDVTDELTSFAASALVRKPFTRDELAAGIELAMRRAEGGDEGD